MSKNPHSQRAANAKDIVAASFVFSIRADGTVLNWDQDNALGVVLGPTFSNCCEQILQLIEHNTGWSLRKVDDAVKPLRVRLVRDGQTIGVISGFRLAEVAGTESGVLFKEPAETQ